MSFLCIIAIRQPRLYAVFVYQSSYVSGKTAIYFIEIARNLFGSAPHPTVQFKKILLHGVDHTRRFGIFDGYLYLIKVGVKVM